MKTVFIISDAFYAWKMRRSLMKAVLDQGSDVVLITNDDEENCKRIEEMGIRVVQVPIQRKLSPIADMVLLWRLHRIIRKEKPNILHCFTIKPNIYGVFAGRIAGVKRIVCTVAGLGQLYCENVGLFDRVMRFAATCMYRASFLFASRVSFQNSDDLQYFSKKKIVSSRKAVLIKSSGINLDDYNVSEIVTEKHEKLRIELGVNEEANVVLMVSRVMWEKGVREFVEASKLVSRDMDDVKFLLVGSVEKGRNEVSVEYLKSQDPKAFSWLCFRDDVKALLRIADVAVLPSFYREGVPYFLLEALAMEKPIITTDNVGCRETVRHGWNGYLAPVKDSHAIAHYVKVVLKMNQLQRAVLGRYSRSIAVEEFSDQIVIQKTIDELYGLQ